MSSPRPNATDDRKLVEASIGGSRDAFGLLVLRHARMVRAICMARVGSTDADDAVQEVFLRAFRGLGRLQDVASFPAYLGQIARNHCIDRLRGNAKSSPLSLDEIELDPQDPRPGEDTGREHLLEQLRLEVARLPESQREVVLLFYFQKMSYADMAHALGITEPAVNQRLSRARQHLRAAFSARSEDGS